MEEVARKREDLGQVLSQSAGEKVTKGTRESRKGSLHRDLSPITFGKEG